MTTFQEIPTGPSQRVMTVALGASIYTLRFGYADVDQGGWFMDIGDSRGNLLVSGIPLVTGADLLAQYRYLGIPGGIFVATDGDSDAVPTFANLGSAGHVYFLAD